MLREIAIKDFAIVEDIRIIFDRGLTILSGETGAGKSIIIQALNLLLGSRADGEMIRSGAQSAELEALFDIDTNGPAAAILAEQGHESGRELIIRRVLSKNNRHRVYINGRLATMGLLARVTENLAGISGQHEHQKLLKESEHLPILDQFAGLSPLRQKVTDCYQQIIPLIKKLRDLEEIIKRQAEQDELLAFQEQEIEDANLEPGEEENLRQQLTRLKNAENLYQTAGLGIEELYNKQGAVAERISSLQKQMEKASGIDPCLGRAAEALADAAIRVEDTAEFLRGYIDGIEFDPNLMETIEARLDLINRLKRKYGGSVEKILEVLEEIKEKKTRTLDTKDIIARTKARLEELHQELTSYSRKLSEKRKAGAKDMSRRMEAELRLLKMDDTRFDVRFKTSPPQPGTSQWLCVDGSQVTESGAEQAWFVIAPNLGEDLKSLSKIASGGELSRIILAIKAITAESGPVETMVFDEVDAGIGGEVAGVVGEKLAELSAANQVICITHLAQIARFGDHHYRISKAVDNGRTTATIKPLDEKGRIEETARMISGQAITDTTLAHAAEMLKTRRRPLSS
jgi:DNA repair protein RecN (Recombination protein N)